MIGLDTNVLVRYLVEDDKDQSQRARAIVAQLTAEEPGFISLVTLLETIWLLQRSYKVDRLAIRRAMSTLVASPALVIHENAAVEEALAMAEAHDHDLPDALLAVLGRRAGCAETMTFDRRAARLPGMTLVPPSLGG
ncbi:MAG: type II toxin-antitoxin system VapC family toxin [Propionibacteriaceae bacterium]|jgi:predicted nucleic-acid-binding protein|nr:type II toxin-antitoxin system VapC family toxin [Propionibacteriaceae bacterium]